MRGPFLLGLLLASLAGAQPPAEPEAYSIVARAREEALRLRTEEARHGFDRSARSYLAAHPQGAHAERVQLWLEELGVPRPPPPLRADRWVGAPLDPARPCGEVTLVVFFSVTHPQTAWLLPRVVRLERRLAARGLRVVGVAAVVDDREHQAPDAVEARVRQLALPFPVAVDRQRADGPSESFRLHGGRALPWIVLVDRYGRAAWRGDGRDPTRVEREAVALLAQPPLDELVAAVRAGRAGVADVAAIRTKEAVSALFDLLPEPAFTAEAREALKTFGPEGWDLRDAEAAGTRWRREAHRFSWPAGALRTVPDR